MEKRCRKNADYYKKSADCAAYVRAEMIYGIILKENHCLLYTSDAADEL